LDLPPEAFEVLVLDPVLVFQPESPRAIPWLMQPCTRPQIQALKSSHPWAGTVESVLLPEAWQSPLETDRDDEAGTRADPVFGSAVGVAVFGSAAGGAGLIVGTLDVDPGAGSCW
jgi:hypothetical protein